MPKCQICSLSFTRSSSLKRHIERKHSLMIKNHKQELQEENIGKVTLFHPFSMVLAGPSGSGKTFWVKRLLENRSTWIQPPPERIIWLYSEWQPLYDDMKKTIPNIEFYKGLPPDMDEEGFLDPDVRNLMVMDDLMLQSTKDTRVSDLFTKGSHHRNLSVICLLQNLFYHGKENRTMSLNSHYLVLFKNPRDQQQISVLGRQMYPGKSQHFLLQYKEATQRPYGYLLVDLKTSTKEKDRLKPNAFEVSPSEMTTRMLDTPHSDSDISEETVETDEEHEPPQKQVKLDPTPMKTMLQPQRQKSEPTWSPKTCKRELQEVDDGDIPFCPRCEDHFITMKDLTDHDCPWSSEKEKLFWLGLVNFEMHMEMDQCVRDQAAEIKRAERCDNKTAYHRAFNESLSTLQKKFQLHLKDFLCKVYQLVQSPLYKRIMSTAERLVILDGFDWPAAIEQSLQQRKTIIRGMVQPLPLEREIEPYN